MPYAAMDDTEARTFEPQAVLVGEHHRVVEVRHDAGELPEGSGLPTSAITGPDHDHQD